jgi:cytidylate kinase
LATDEFTQRRRQQLARKFLEIARDELEQKIHTRDYYIERAAFYGLEVDDIAEHIGMTQEEVLEVLQVGDAA